MKRLFAFDVDGTLIDDEKKVLESTKRAVKRIIENGDIAMINTGRAYGSTIRIAKEAGIQEIMGCSGGIYFNTQTGEKLFDDKGLSYHDVKEIFDIFTHEDSFTIIGLGATHIYVYNHFSSDLIRNYERDFSDDKRHIFAAGEQDGFLNAIKEHNEIQKIYVHPIKLQNYDKIRADFFALPDYEKFAYVFFDVDNAAEFNIKGVNKWFGIERYVEHFGIDPHEVYTFGDSENDLEMISNASHGIAMGNAVKSIKDVAKYVTSSNNEDGIEKVVNMVYENVEF